MPRNKKEGIIFGLCMCCIMAFFMSLLNISIGMGGLSANSFLTALKAYPVILLVVFIIENLIVAPINFSLLRKFAGENDSNNAKILFNCFFIVTMMSLIMTIVGSLLGGQNVITILDGFFTSWPRNYVAALFLNILIAGPISRMVLRKVQESSSEKDAIGS